MSEVRPWVGSLISAGQFETLRDLVLINCSSEHSKVMFHFEEPAPLAREQADNGGESGRFRFRESGTFISAEPYLLELRIGAGASSIGDLLNLLCDSQGRREQIFGGDELKPQMIVLKNGNHIKHLSGLETKLDEGDTIVLIPPVGGG